MARSTQQSKPEAVTLVKDGQKRTVTNATDLVKAKHDGWVVEQAPKTQTQQKQGNKE